VTEQRSNNRTKFVVDLGNLELPPIIERQIESEIRAVVLKALTNPELGVARQLDPSIFGRFPGRTLGLWIDPDHPEEGSWEDTAPRIPGRSREGVVTPFVSHNVAVFRSKLASTKAHGAEAIRISRVKNGDVHIEQLGARGQTVVEFVLHPITSSAKEVTAVEIKRIDSSGPDLSLGRKDRLALAAIVDELRQFKESSAPGVIYFWSQLLAVTEMVLACGAAVLEGAANPAADAACVLSAGHLPGPDDPD
jgi:hypothetical protein